MSNPPLPPELLDHVVDLLHHIPGALKSCCLVSKSWIPRARRHLFSHVAFYTPQILQSWKTVFPHPSTSPACYTRSLFFTHPRSITVADVEEGSWIPTFSQVVHFEILIPGKDVGGPEVSFIAFHGFSPALRSLRVISPGFPSSHVPDFIHSFLHLQNLAVVTDDWGGCSKGFYTQPVAIQPPSPLAFTGTLKLYLETGMNLVAPRLLSLPNGLHFRELRLAWNCEEDVLLTMELVERCSPTLETLKVKCEHDGQPTGIIDLSKAINLKEVDLVGRGHSQWITTTLRTLTSNHLNFRRISLRASGVLYALFPHLGDPTTLRTTIGEAVFQEWLELDRLLTHLWESRSIHLKVAYDVPFWVDGPSARRCVESLFPEVTTRGIVDLVELSITQEFHQGLVNAAYD